MKLFTVLIPFSVSSITFRKLGTTIVGPCCAAGVMVMVMVMVNINLYSTL